MTTYEILLMLDPEHADARQDEIVSRTRELVEKGGGARKSHDPWGRRRLAYPISHKEEGVYHLVVFESDAATLDEVSRVLKIDDAVLRHMATRHIEGSRTGAPRDELSGPAPAVPAPAEAEAPVAEEEPIADEPVADEPEADVSAAEEPEYAPTDEEPAEAPGEEEE